MSLSILLKAAVAGMRTDSHLHLLLPRNKAALLVGMDDPDCGCLSAMRIDSDGVNVTVSSHHLARLGDQMVIEEFEAQFASMPLCTGGEPDWEPHDWQPL